MDLVVRLRRCAHHPPLLTILLTNVQSLDNRVDELRARISVQRDIRDCNILCFIESWLTWDIQSPPYSQVGSQYIVQTGKKKSPGRRKADNIQKLKFFCSPNLEYLNQMPTVLPPKKIIFG
jgi:hypothetical protein